jgi:hypothetical protein
MSIAGSTAGGTFTSSLAVYYEAQFQPVGGGTGPAPVFGMVALTGAATWAPVPPPGAIIVPGPFGDQNANLHSGLPSGEVDFFVVLCTLTGADCAHIVTTAVPEPSTWIMLLTAGTIVPIYAKRVRRRA